MKIKHQLDSLDGVDDAIKQLYTQSEDGKYRLEIEGLNVDGLLKKNSELLTEAKTAKQRAEAIELAAQEAERKRLEESNEYKTLYTTAQQEAAATKAALDALKKQRIEEVRTAKAVEFAGLVSSNPKARDLLAKELMADIQADETGAISLGGSLTGDDAAIKSHLVSMYPFLADAVHSSGGGAVGGVNSGATSPASMGGSKAERKEAIRQRFKLPE